MSNEYCECPQCKYIISWKAIMLMKHDVGCPRCKTSLFRFRYMKELERLICETEDYLNE